MKKLLILLLFPLIMFAQDSTLIGDVDCSGEVNSQDASLILQFVTNVIDTLPCEANMTGLTPEQLQEIINLMSEQLNVNYTGGGSSNYPAMISSISSESMNFGSALIFCDELEEDGYTDWFLPNIEQLIYSVGGGCEIPDQRTDNVLWSSTPLFNSYYDTEYVYMIGENQDALIQSDKGNGLSRCRCVRFGEGETSEGSSNSSGSGSGSSVGGSSEQPITMIGPMYLPEEFDFSSIFSINSNDNSYYEMFYFDAIRFCAELEYNNFSDWFLPSLYQLQNYYLNNITDGIVIPNHMSGNLQFWTRIDANNPFISFYIPGLKIKGADSSLPYQMSEVSPLSANTVSHCFCVR